MAMETNFFSMDYVYVPSGEADFKKVHVDLHMSTSRPEFTIQSDEEISQDSLEQIIRSFQKEKFNRIKIDLSSDCDVIASIVGQKYLVCFERDELRVSKLVPIEE